MSLAHRQSVLENIDLWYSTFARIWYQPVRHHQFTNSPHCFKWDYLCLYFNFFLLFAFLWFNFTPSHLQISFGALQSLQLGLHFPLCNVVWVLSSIPLLELQWLWLFHYYGFICHLHFLNKFSSFNSFLLSPLRTRIQASLVKQTFLLVKPSVITINCFRNFGHQHFLQPYPK